MFRLSTCALAPLALTLTCFGATKSHLPAPSRVEAIRFWSFGDVTRIAIQTQGDYKLATDQIERPYRVYFDLNGIRPPATAHHGIQTIPVGDKRVKQIRIAEVSPGRTRIVCDLEGPAEVVSSQLVNPDRLIIELRPKGTSLPALSASRSNTPSHGAGPELPQTETPLTASSSSVSDGSAEAKSLPTAETTPPVPILSKPIPASVPATATSSRSAPSAARRDIGIVSPAKRPNGNDSSLVRVFGLKLGKVVIDAGHGGHDTGTIGPNGLLEKELVLDVAMRLGKLITQQLGANVIYTRSDDTFVPLEERTKIANNEKADLFISIHANSSPEPSATGVETYFFNFTSDRNSLDIATRENATSKSSISDLNDLLHRAVLQAKFEESREFAQQVQRSLWASSVKMNNRSRDRGVRQAPFVVLIGAAMPSILAEIGFVSNPHDEKLLLRPDQRQKIAEALYKGVSRYANSLSHLEMARARVAGSE
ncbi:MAG: N-acetylmuramoyl-L-alanine amidase [Acidobacteriaceae bacterium]|nr:N-acetylmuramoyl-L-alanine amidase [Acidobacteriaceae bacterium]